MKNISDYALLFLFSYKIRTDTFFCKYVLFYYFPDLVDGKVAHFFLLHEDASLQYFIPAVHVWSFFKIISPFVICFIYLIVPIKITSHDHFILN